MTDRTCPARLAVGGRTYMCDAEEMVLARTPTGSHKGWAHSSRASGTVWTSDGDFDELPEFDDPSPGLLRDARRAVAGGFRGFPRESEGEGQE